MSTTALSASWSGSIVGPAIRNLAAIGAAGILVGVPAGLLSRAIMKIGALAGGPTVAGVHTANGNVVGDFTVSGTLALVIFAGVVPAISAGVLYLGLRPWLLRLGSWRGPALGAYGLALTSFGVVLEPGNNDFVRFGPAALNVAMFAALFIVVGIAIAPVADASLRVAEHPSPGQLVLLGPGLLLAAFVTFALGVGGTAGAWTARTRGEHFGSADAAALLFWSVAIGILAQQRKTARPFGLAMLAALLAVGAWATASAVRFLLAA